MKNSIFILILLPFAGISQEGNLIARKMDSIFNNYFKADEPGGAVLLVKEGKVIYRQGFGIADTLSREPISTSTLFNIGSITKPFVAYGLLKLAEEGRLSLQDPLLKYFPDFDDKRIADKVKLYHLLTHTSGIPDSRKVQVQKEFYLTAKDEENFAPLKQTKTLLFEPGTRYKYSNPAFNGLALVIEKTTGRKWQDFILDKIFRPSGMQASTITDGSHPREGVAHGYIAAGAGKFEELDYGEEPTFAAAGNGGVWSSVEELWLFEQAIQGATFLQKEWIDKSRSIFPFPVWADSTNSRLGLSWFITREIGQEMIGHTGSQGGFISDYCWFPGKKLFYVLLCNTPKPIQEIRARVLETALF